MRTRWLPLLACFVAWAGVGAVHGQVPDSSAVDSMTVQLPEITVEAARSTETAASAPFAVSVLQRSDAELSLTPNRSLDDVLRPLPGIWVNDRHHFALGERISVRGVGYRSNFGVRGIQVVLDGIPLTLPDGQAFLDVVDPAVVRQVELVRSPASVFWGNGSGGVLFLSTRPESPGNSLRARMQGGSFGTWQGLVEGSVTAGDWRVRGFASGNGQDGYRDHSQGMRLRAGATAATALSNNTTLRLTAAGDVQDTENPSSLTLEQFRSDPSQARGAFVDVNAGKQSEQGQAGAFLSHDLGDYTLSASAYYVYRSLDNPLSFGLITYDRNSGGARIAVRRSGGVLEGGIGVDIGAQRDDRTEYEITPNRLRADSLVTLDQIESVFSGSAFSYLRFNATDRFSMTGGVRVDGLRFKADDRLVDTSSQQDREDRSGSRRFSALSPSFGFTFDTGPALLFAQYSTAFETPTASELSNRPGGGGGFNQQVEPQRVRGFEIGTRGATASPELQFELNLYRLNVEDLITSTEEPDGSDIYENLGDNTHDGVEVSLTWQATESVQLAARYTGTRFTIEEARTDSLEGNRVPGIPSRRIYLHTQIEHKGVWARISGQGVTSYYTNNANTDQAPRYVLVDLRLGHRGLDLGAATVKPFVGVDNLLDERYAGSVVINAFGGRYYEPGPSRAYSAGVNVVW